LSLEPIFGRSHGALYEGLARGGVDAKAIRDLLLGEHRPTALAAGVRRGRLDLGPL